MNKRLLEKLSVFLCLFVTVSLYFVAYKNYQDSAVLSATTESAPTSLVGKDASGDYDPKSDESEVIDKRTESFKTFKKEENGQDVFRVAGQIGAIHYKTDPFSKTEQYKEIDLTLKTNTNDKYDYDYYLNQNGYQLNIWNQRKVKDSKVNYAAKFIRAGQSISMAPVSLAWENSAGEYQEISKPVSGINPEIDNDNYTITWKNAFGKGIDFRYNISPDKFFKTVVINDKSDLPAATIGSDGLKLTIVMSTAWSDVEAENDFAKDNKNKDLASEYKPVDKKDESKDNPAEFSYEDDQSRDLWFVQKPLAWDSSVSRNVFDMDYKLEKVGDDNFMKLSVKNEDIQNQLTVYPLLADAAITEEKIGASSDDAYYFGSFNSTATATYLNTSTNSAYVNGFRFTTVPIPQGATISSASISPYVYSTSYDDPKCRLYLDDADSSATFSSGSAPNARTKTTAYTDWTATGVGAGYHASADISTAVEEVVGRANWASNNDLSIITNTNSSSTGMRVYTYDYGTSYVAKFNASYSANITVSGTIYTAEDKSTNIGANKTVAMSIDGGAKTTVETGAGGTFSFTNVSGATAGKVVSLFLDGETEISNYITISNDTDITSLELFTNRIAISHENSGPQTNTTLAKTDSTFDSDIKYTISSGNIDFADGYKVYIVSGKTYTPGGTVELDSFESASSATFDLAANNITVHGSWKSSTTSTFTSSGTATFDGSSGTQTIDSGSTYSTPGTSGIDNVDFTDFVKNGAGTLQITGHVLVLKTSITVGTGAVLDLNSQGIIRATAGTSLTATWNGKIKVYGQEPQLFFSSNSYTTGTAEYYGTGDYSETIFYMASGCVINNLELTGTGTFTTGASTVKETNGYLKLSDGELAGTSFTSGGDYTQTAGTLSAALTVYGNVSINGGTASGAIIQDALNGDRTFSADGVTLSAANGLTLINTSSSNRTITLGSGTITITNTFSIKADGNGNLTVDASVNNPSVAVNSTQNSGFNARAGSGAGTEYLKMGSGTWSLSAAPSFADGTVTANTSTLSLTISTDYSSNYTPSTNTFYNYQIHTTGTYAITARSAMNVSNNFTLDAAGAGNLTFNLLYNSTFKNVDFVGTGSGTEIFDAGSGFSHTISGNADFTGGTFTAGTSDVTLNGTGAQSITSAGNSWNNLIVTNASASGVTFADSATVTGTFTDTAASSQLFFTASATYTFANISISGQATGTRIFMRSTTSGTHWHFNVAQASPVASYVNVKDSDASGGNTIDGMTGGYDANGNTNWNLPVNANNSPTNDSLTFTNPYSSNTAVADNTTEWNFRALVSDVDGATNLDYVELRLANSADSTQPYDSLKFRWTEATDTFSEIADTQSAVTLTSTSANSSVSGNQWTLDFKIKINSSFLAKDTNYPIELYSVDDAAASDNDNYANIYQVKDLSLAFAVDSNTLSFGSLLPGSVLTGTTQTTATTNYPNGYSLSVSDGVSSTDSALLHTDTTTKIADYAGTIATPTAWTGTGFGICVYDATGKNTTQWGNGTTETDSNNKYAGVPQNATVIHSKTGSPTSSDVSKIGYKLVVPNTQKTGAYSGVITYSATGALN